ncbi:Tll0287-like domain-containing protein [Pararhodonellum marinum]|uniref:Tll0287-like domain-containing protein n=1 Tax=Pararhodonellum marinum TaxID=2755358 RepID=UPI00188FC630|nr:DUF3365 domain-containing protein [Pararhodonellum marinum]
MNRKALHCLFSGFFFFALLSCGNQERVSKEVFDEVKESMEVKKVNESDLINKAMEWGESISQEAQQQLISTLQKAITEKGVPGAVEFCQAEALPILKEVSDKYQVKVRRVSNDYRNPQDQPKEFESGLLSAYEYNVENDLDSRPNIQKLNQGTELLFTKAIMIPSTLCLNCHGDAETDISPETMDKIKSLYPEDKAIGHKVGDLRGMWSILMPTKEVIKQL